MPSALPARIAVTGGAGNLGRKLIAALLADPGCVRVHAIDIVAGVFDDARVVPVAADLRDRAGAWRAAIADSDAVVHLAAENPYPSATWLEAARSFDMTAHVIDAAATGPVRRFVFASSNHVMGGYKDTDTADRPGALTTDLPPLTGTHAGEIDSTAYATAKLMGERLLASRATRDGMTGVSLRIGWCQPGANDPATITLTGLPAVGAPPASPEEQRDLRWFRGMWLSNGDFVGAVMAALSAEAAGWPAPAVIVNAMSANAGMCWEIGESARLIGYRPADGIGKQ